MYFIRHGKTLWNLEGRYLGATDEKLSAEGKAELIAKWRGNGLLKETSLVYSSPMTRCLETARILFPEIQPRLEPGFKERNFGIFEGKTYRELKDRRDYADFIASKGEKPPAGGEGQRRFLERIEKGLASVFNDMERRNDQKSVIITHGGVIMAVFSKIYPAGGELYGYMVENGGGYSALWDAGNKSLKITGKL